MCRRLLLTGICGLLLVAPASAQYVTGVPYFHQYFNSINPSGSCQNTTIAIALAHYGAELHPDDIAREYGTQKAQTVTGWQEIFNAQAQRFGLSVRDSAYDNASMRDVRRRLDAGLPVPVHGAFTASGHLIVLLGYDDQYYYVHDPAGDWARRYQLDTPTAGRYARYPREAVVRAIESPLNRYVRMHALYFEPASIEAEWTVAPPDTVVAGDRQLWHSELSVVAPFDIASVTVDLRDLGAGLEAMTAVDDNTWQLTTSFDISARAGRHQVSVQVGAGDEQLLLKHGVDVMASDNAIIYDDARTAFWDETFVHNVTVESQGEYAYAGDRALSMNAQSFIYELTPAEPVDWTGYGTLRFAFHPGDADGGRTVAFSILANEDPRALVKLIDGDIPGVGIDLGLQQWQVVEIPLSAFSWLESPLTSLRFFGSLRGTFYLDAVELIADRPFPFDIDWVGSVPDTISAEGQAHLELAVRLTGNHDLSGSRVIADLTDLGGTSQVALLLDASGVHRSTKLLERARLNNGRAEVRIDVTYADADRTWHASLRRPVVVVPAEDVLIYGDRLEPDWREVEVTNVTIDHASESTVFTGSRAMSWDANNLIVEYQTENPIDPVGFSVLRLHVHPGSAEPGRLRAFSVLFNGDSRSVVRLLDVAEGLDLSRRQWQQLDVPLADLQEPIHSLRIFGDLTGTLHVDDVRFVAATVSTPSTAVTESRDVLPMDFTLGQAWPNPFNSSVVLPFQLQAGADIDLSIFDLLGQRVAVVSTGWRAAGTHHAVWHGVTTAGANAASGVYMYRLTTKFAGIGRPADRQHASGKLLLLR